MFKLCRFTFTACTVSYWVLLSGLLLAISLPHTQISMFHLSIYETAKAHSKNKTSLWGSKLVSNKNRIFIRCNDQCWRILRQSIHTDYKKIVIERYKRILISGKLTISTISLKTGNFSPACIKAVIRNTNTTLFHEEAHSRIVDMSVFQLSSIYPLFFADLLRKASKASHPILYLDRLSRKVMSPPGS